MPEGTISLPDWQTAYAEKPKYGWFDWLFLILAGIYDPIAGLITKITSLFWVPPLHRRHDNAVRRRRGLTVVLGGIEGPSSYNVNIVHGILRSNYRGSVKRLDWNEGSWLTRSGLNLMSTRHQEAEARKVADYIHEYRKQFPDAPICLIGQSGGAWIVIRALELLEGSDYVHSAILLAAAISPSHDLSKAASRCKSGIISFWSRGDFVFLAFGTTVLGTADRVHGVSSGFTPWMNPPQNVVQLEWRREWIRHRYWGNHTSSSSRSFVQHVVAPMLATI